MPFSLHPRLAAGSIELGRLDTIHVLLKDNALFPWIILVPEVEEGIEDLHQLDPATYSAVTAAIRTVSDFVATHFKPSKLNVACIGNQVRQMHIHIVGRSPDDAAWPGVVWSHAGKEAYPSAAIETIHAAWRQWAADHGL